MAKQRCMRLHVLCDAAADHVQSKDARMAVATRLCTTAVLSPPSPVPCVSAHLLESCLAPSCLPDVGSRMLYRCTVQHSKHSSPVSRWLIRRARDRRFPQLCMAPEGTCSDGRCLLQVVHPACASGKRIVASDVSIP